MPVQLASRAGARVVGTIRSLGEEATARKAGAHEVIANNEKLVENVRAVAPGGIDHIMEVAFGANIERDVELLNNNGSIATYATNVEKAGDPLLADGVQEHSTILPWQRRLPPEGKDLGRAGHSALQAGWAGFEIAERVPLEEIARAHELSEDPVRPGRVVVII